MLDKLVFEPRFEGVFQQVFGKAVVCRDLDIADTCARGHGFTAVTLDGDRIGKKGELSEGQGFPKDQHIVARFFALKLPWTRKRYCCRSQGRGEGCGEWNE
jgi:chromosome segregation ATPase